MTFRRRKNPVFRRVKMGMLRSLGKVAKDITAAFDEKLGRDLAPARHAGT